MRAVLMLDGGDDGNEPYGSRPSEATVPRTIEVVYRTEAPRLLQYFRRRLRGADDPRDLVQEAFARLIGSAPAGMLRNPEAYLQRIARNMLIDRSRKRSGKIIHVPISDGAEIPVLPDQSYAIEADDMKRLYLNAVEALPPRTRQVFLLHRVDELSYKVIAEDLGLSIRTVEWHIAEAIMRIGTALKPK